MAEVADACIPQLHACRTRLCLLDTDGSPLAGAESMIVSDALVKATLKAVYKDASEISEQNACDETKIDYLGPASLVRYDIDFDFITADPFLHSVMLGGAVLEDGGAFGYQFPKVGIVTGDGYSLELFCKRYDPETGDLSTVHPYAQWALPKIKNPRVGDREFSNTAQHSLISASCYGNDLWFDGPANDFPVDSSGPAQWFPCDTLPDVACGFTGVVAAS